MLLTDKHALLLRLKDFRNKYLFAAFIRIQPVYRKVFSSRIAYIYCRHPVITPFLINLKLHMGITVHFLRQGSDFSGYDKVIVPNGRWHDIKPTADLIPEEKKVYMEVGFFPQNKNVYFDSLGVHGYSSIPHASCAPLTENDKSLLLEFKRYYTSHNFLKYEWDTVEGSIPIANPERSRYGNNFIFVPLQLETDTAFELCPFVDNQAMIDKIQSVLPEHKIIFKVHPWDSAANYSVGANNVLLPPTNRDLRELLLHSDAVISCNSTVMLEALLYGKKCASLGVGFASNHKVSLECQDDITRLAEIDHWHVDQEAVDRFLFFLIRKQINVKFWQSTSEKAKLTHWLKEYDLLQK